MPQFRIRQQRQLFEEPLPVPAVRLPLEVQEQLRQTLAQWMQAQTKINRKEVGNEQDQR
jgi:hypothetical protein